MCDFCPFPGWDFSSREQRAINPARVSRGKYCSYGLGFDHPTHWDTSTVKVTQNEKLSHHSNVHTIFLQKTAQNKYWYPNWKVVMV